MTELGASQSTSSPTSPEKTATAPEPTAAPGIAGPTSLRGLGRALLVLLHLLPKNAMSRWVGRFASLSLPGPIQRAEIRLFARIAGVDLSEARDDVADFDSLQRFFTRALVDGARPIEGGEDVLVSPCDGAWGESGRIDQGTMMQVKGRAYRVADLLGDPALAANYEGGCYATFYLSPRDYHRFHTPTAGRITRLDYHPGALWPVNNIGLNGVNALFARNERICAFLETETTDGPPVILIAVGATNVGSVRLTFSELHTNEPGAARVTQELGDHAPHFARGEEWGHFEFGSTIVMLTPPGGATIEPRPTGTSLRLGESIGSAQPHAPA